MKRPEPWFAGMGAFGLALWAAGIPACAPGEADPQSGGVGAGGGIDGSGGRTGGGTESAAGAGNGGELGAGAVPEECAIGTPSSSDDSADSFPACEHPEVVANCEDGWCEIPAGCLVMGSPESEWGHPPYAETQLGVTLTHAFLIQETEVTIDQWTGAGLPLPEYVPLQGSCPHEGFPCAEPCLEPSCPVASVSWFEAAAYANLLSERHDPPLELCYRLSCEGPTEQCYPSEECEGEVGVDFVCSYAEVTAETVYDCEGFRLPTSAEWEYAARAGTKTAYYSGSNWDYGDQVRCGAYCNSDPNLEQIGWYCHNSGGRAHPVGDLSPNAWGLYDMAGNVYEFVYDKMDDLGAQSTVDPVVVGLGHPQREMRGGGFSIWAEDCRMANQSAISWNGRGAVAGFRLVRTLP